MTQQSPQRGIEYRLHLVRVFSFRWQESVAFYRDLVGFPLGFLGEDIGWAQFELGGAAIGLERCDPGDPETAGLVGRFVGVSIEVEDIQTTFERLAARGVRFLGAPEPQPWGGTLAHFQDPDGNVLTLLGRRDPGR